MKSIVILFLSIISISAFCKTPQSEAEFKKISEEISQITKELQSAWDSKDEEALYSSNIERNPFNGATHTPPLGLCTCMTGTKGMPIYFSSAVYIVQSR